MMDIKVSKYKSTSADQLLVHDRALVWVQEVKALKNVGFFKSGWEINGLKNRKPSIANF